MFLVPSCAILLWMSRRSRSVTQNSMRIGLVRSAMLLFASFKLQRTFQAENLVPAQKKSRSLYNGHFSSRLAGMEGTKFSSRKVFLSLYNGQFFAVCPGFFKKICWIIYFAADIFQRKAEACLKKVKTKMLPALEKAEASRSADMRF